LITGLFSSSDAQRDPGTTEIGAFDSFWSLISVLSRLSEKLRPSRRRTVRLPLEKACRLQFEGTVLPGTTRDISFAGASAVFPGIHEVRSQHCTLSIEDVELTVSPTESVSRGDETLVRFRVETITKGEPKWQAWHHPSSR
jgi:hypothetical protein